MKDYNVKLSVRNNKILSMMQIYGIDNNAELSNLSGISQTTIGRMVNLKDSGLNAFGKIRSQYKMLADFFKVLPEDIIPESQMFEGLDLNYKEIEMNFDEILSLKGKDAELIEYKDTNSDKLKSAVDSLLSGLKPRDAEVLKMYYGIEGDQKTIQEIADCFKISKGRMHQIKHKAERKLRANVFYEKGIYSETSRMSLLELLHPQKSLN